MHARLLVMSLLTAAVCSSPSTAGWTYTVLTPVGVPHAEITSISGNQQGGLTISPNNPGYWSGTAGSWVNLLPAGATTGRVNGIANGQQAGNARIGGNQQAGIWTGTAASWVNLHPAGASVSYAYDTNGTQQVGHAQIGAQLRACLWSGTVLSRVDLHPGAAAHSYATAISPSGNEQVGYAGTAGAWHAGKWNGTAASWVDLHPAGSTNSSAYGTNGSQQVGEAYFGATTSASLWSGTAASWVNLHPAGAQSSRAMGIAGNWQVGYTIHPSSIHRAAIWNGNAASHFDLHSLLPATYAYSEATTVEVVGNVVYVGGHATKPTIVDRDAILWKFTLDTPGDINGDGHVNVSDLLAVITAWGPCPVPPTTCSSDIAPLPSGDGQVNVNDLLMVITNWG